MMENIDDKYRASKELEEIYSKLTKEFETNPECRGFEECFNPEQVYNLKGVAGNIYRWFSTHFYKAKDIIYRYEDQNPSFSTSIFSQENITILDIGAGPGTFCLALLDILYKELKDHVPKINIIMVEPSEYNIYIAKRLINEFCDKILIEANIYIINEYFPEDECIRKIYEILNTINNDFLIISMCNILKWVKDEFKKRRIDIVKLIEPIIHKIEPLHTILLSVEPAKFDDLGRLQRLVQSILNRIYNRYDYLKSNKYKYRMYNFPNSYFYKERRGKIYESYYGSIVTYNTTTSKMADSKELFSSFFKARMSLKKEFPYDEIAIKLFEYNLEDSINRFSKEILKGYKFNTDFIGYKVPKNEKDDRQKVMDNIFDTIAGASFLDIIGIGIDREFSSNCCGNRLNKKLNTEYSYEYFWYGWYYKFMKKAFNKVLNENNYYLKLDIKSFYTNINQNILYDKIIKLIPYKDSRLKEFINSLIKRHIPYVNNGKGLPQGSLTSGFLANLYLDDFDKYFISKTNDGYMRYVDDIFIFGKTEEQIKELGKEAENKLKDLYLEINKEKTSMGDKSSLKNIYYDDKELDDFQKRLDRILHSIYSINKEYYEAYKNNREVFVNWYSDCLKSIGLIISPDWLNRKIYYEKNIIKRIVRLFSKYYTSVNYPKYIKVNLDVDRWRETFINENQKFIKEIDKLKQQLSLELQNLYNKYGSLTSKYDDITLKKIRAKYRFYTYRAGILYNPDVVNVIENIMEYTWLYNITVLRSYPQLLKKMINLLRHTKSKYLKYAIIWAFGEMKDKCVINILENILFDTNSSDMLKLMCSQSLIKINVKCDEIDQDKLLKEIEIQYKNGKTYILKNLILLLSDNNIKKVVENYNMEVFDTHSIQLLESAIKVKKDKINIIANLERLPEGIDPLEYPDIEPGPEIAPFY